MHLARSIPKICFASFTCVAAACSTDSGTSPAGSGGAVTGSSGGVPVTGGTNSGRGGSTALGGTSASGGSIAGGSGASSSGGLEPVSGGSGGSLLSSGGNSNAGSSGAGQQSGGTGGAFSGGSGGGGANSGGSPGGNGGASGNTMPHGSAAKYICEPGKSYGDPLSGMGTIQQVGPPPSDYFAFIEGPVWIGKIGTLFFSDNASSPSERIFKLVPPSTTPAVLLPTSNSNGLAVGNNDEIVATDQRNRAIVRLDAMSGATIGSAISTGNAKPNDVIARSDGNFYFTDPDTGFYRISPSGMVSAAMKLTQGSRPNGLALSLDESVLYIGDVGNKSITKYTLASDGSVDTTAPAALVSAAKNDVVDGLCVDCAGNVYASTANGVEVYSASGAYIGTVPTGEASNCTFGGADRKTLYVTSRALLKYVTLNVPGLPD